MTMESNKEENVIKERLNNKVSEQIGQIEGLRDDFVTSWKELNKYKYLYGIGVKPLHAKGSILHAKKIIAEYEEVLLGKDKMLVEGYSNFTKPQLKKIVSWWEGVITDCERIISDGKFIRASNRQINKKVKEYDEKFGKRKSK